MMKPVAQGPHDTGLLEYLEDIIGTDKYKPQLEESAKRCCLAPTPLPFLGSCLPKCNYSRTKCTVGCEYRTQSG